MNAGNGDRKRVLLLDTSPLVMRNLERVLKKIGDCVSEQADSVRTALLSISQNPPDLILTEWELSDLTAAELLQVLKTRKEWKEIPVIICTSSGSTEISNEALKLGARDVMKKPINQQSLRKHLDQLFPEGSQKRSKKELPGKRNIRSELRHIGKLAPLPILAKSIIEISADPNASARNLAAVVKKDQSLTAKILKIVNSAYYGFYRKIGNVDHAIVILGFNEIKNISLAACIIRAYVDDSDPLFNREKFWLHALGSAYISRALSSFKPTLNTEDAFVIGLLHDIGKVVLAQHFTDLFSRCLNLAKKRKQPLHKVSAEVMEIDHAEVGGLVAEGWRLPVPLVRAIQFHHNPAVAGKDDYNIHLAHLANYFCHSNRIGESGNPVPDEPFAGSLKAFGLDKQDLDDVWRSLMIDTQSVKNAL